jgi:hypothetical protein
VRSTLVAALAACAAQKARSRLRRFLAGLSADELEFLAGFQGARILEGCSGATPGDPSQPADYVAREAGGCGADLDHKLMVLREYLTRCSCMLSII